MPRTFDTAGPCVPGGLDEGYLVLFDRRPEVSWEAKLFEREAAGLGGKRIVVLGA